MKKILTRYQERLADLSRRNRSIRLARVVKRRTFDIATLAALEKELPDSVVHTITLRGRAATLLKANARDKKSEAILTNIHLLRRHIDATFKETGAQEGYLGYPFVQGTFSDGTFFRCPLILYPVAIDYTPQGKSIALKPLDRKPILNKTFFMAFNKYNKGKSAVALKRLDEFEDLNREELLPWALAFLKDADIEIVAPSQNPTVLPIPDLLKDSYPVSDPHTITVLPYAVVGDFSQANSALSADYDELIKTERLSKVAELIMGSSKEKAPNAPVIKEIDPPERDNFFATRPDSSQEQALLASRSGNGIVVHGPPGTGKSQVIVNLIADSLVRGQKVLVVCEKRAALDVVKNRLGKQGIEKYAVLVHDAEADRNDVFKRMATNLETFEQKHTTVVTAQAVDAAKNIDAMIDALQKQVSAFEEATAYGLPLYAMYSASRKDGPRLTMKAHALKHAEVEALAARVAELQADALYDMQGAIRHRKPFAHDFDHKAFVAALPAVKKDLLALEKAAAEIIPEANRGRSVLDNAMDYEHWKLHHHKAYRFALPTWWTLERHFEKHSVNDGFTARWELFSDAVAQSSTSFLFLQEHFTNALFAEVSTRILSCSKASALIDELMKLDIDDVATFDYTKAKLTAYERAVYDRCVALKAADWKEAIVNSHIVAWIEGVEARHGAVRDFDGNSYKRARAEIVKTLAVRDALTPKLIEEYLAKRYGEIRADEKTVQPLLHEVQKVRKRPTIRSLNEQFIDRGLLELFPCWLCSPETASSIFPLRPGLFDVIVYDEASQLRLERAIPSLVRARRVMIAGDENQLPPSSFFDSAVEDEEEDETIDEEARQALEDESLLIRSKYALPGHKLAHHYRSRRAELIDFSNHAFYEDGLRIVPRNTAFKGPAITYTNVHGTWAENTNTKEAKHVVKLLKELLHAAPSKTYGVITFNFKQRELIEDLLDEEAATDAAFAKALATARSRTDNEEDVSLFVKNIENVQGDERDVIIFSVAYGKDNTGKLRHQFGPLNGVYGRNRLNVAVTRAREAIHVVASIEPTDLHYSGTFEGPKQLQEYLAYCKRVSLGDAPALRAQENNDAFVNAVADALRALGHKVTVPVGAYGYTIDIGVEYPKKRGTFIVGIECETAAYHALKGAKERDIYRQSVLEQNGWTMLRVWSRDWWKNPDVEARRLDREIKALA